MTIPLPFAGGANASRDTIGKDSSTLPNYTDGFPANYSAPHAAGGSFILRKQMNAFGYMASKNQWFQQAGGIYTFDKDWSDANGGYPKGAILSYVVDGTVYAVMSLVNDNTWNFNEDGVDNVHWQLCSPGARFMPTFDVSKKQYLWNDVTANMTPEFSALSGNLVMPFDGYLNYLSSVDASVPGLGVGVINSIDSGFTGASQVVIPFVPTQVISGCVMGVVLGITSPTDGTEIAEDVELDTSNFVSGERNCAVFIVDGMGMAAGGAGCGLIPVKKGSKIKVFGHQTFSSQYQISMPYTHTTTSGTTTGTKTETIQGSFSMKISLEAYPIS